MIIFTQSLETPTRMGSGGKLRKHPIIINTDTVNFFEPVEEGEHVNENAMRVTFDGGRIIFIEETPLTLADKISGYLAMNKEDYEKWKEGS